MYVQILIIHDHSWWWIKYLLFIMHHSYLIIHYSQLGFIMSFIRWFIQVFLHSFNPRGRNFLIPCNVIDNCDCIPLNKNALGDVSLPPCPFCVILSIPSNSKLKHLLTKEFSGSKDIRHLAETSFINLNHFRYDYSILFQIDFWNTYGMNTSNIQNKSLNESLPICCHMTAHLWTPPAPLHLPSRWNPSERLSNPGSKMSFFSERKFGKRIFVQLLSQGNTFQQNHHQSVRTCFFSLKGFPNALPETSTAIEFCWVELLWPLSGGESPSGRCRKTSMPGENWLSESWLKGRFQEKPRALPSLKLKAPEKKRPGQPSIFRGYVSLVSGRLNQHVT